MLHESQFKRVVVLILTYNGKHLLDDSVESYLSNDYPNLEVVVVDNGSTDGTQTYVENKWPQARFVETGANLGYSGGFNYGLDYAFNNLNADYALVTNNDVRADSKVITELVKVAESDPTIGFVTGKVYYYDKADTLQTVGKYEDHIRWNGDHIGHNEVDEGQYDHISERIFADDIFTLASRKLYLETGGYDTTFRFQAEEYDWQARAKERGYKIYYTPHAKVWHKVSMTLGKSSPAKAYYDARNPMLVILNHKDSDFFRRYFWTHLYNDVFLVSLLALKRLRPRVAMSVWRGFFSGIFWGFSKRKFTSRHFIGR